MQRNRKYEVYIHLTSMAIGFFILRPHIMLHLQGLKRAILE